MTSRPYWNAVSRMSPEMSAICRPSRVKLATHFEVNGSRFKASSTSGIKVCVPANDWQVRRGLWSTTSRRGSDGQVTLSQGVGVGDGDGPIPRHAFACMIAKGSLLVHASSKVSSFFFYRSVVAWNHLPSNIKLLTFKIFFSDQTFQPICFFKVFVF